VTVKGILTVMAMLMDGMVCFSKQTSVEIYIIIPVVLLILVRETSTVMAMLMDGMGCFSKQTSVEIYITTSVLRVQLGSGVSIRES